jgi:hypothetical protein
MTTIHAKTIDQVLMATVLPKVACNNQNTVRLHVDFDSAWDGYAKTAVFYSSKNPTPYEKVLSSDGIRIVPPEVLIETATLFISIKGVSGTAIKSTTVLKYKISVGTPSVVISDPTNNVYNQLLSAYSGTNEALAVERERINNLARLGAGSTTGDAELITARTDFAGTTHANLQTAINTHTKKLTRGRYAFAILLPSGAGEYPSISTTDKTFIVGEDTLLINDRIPGGVVSLCATNGNNIAKWGEDWKTSAICFFLSFEFVP